MPIIPHAYRKKTQGFMQKKNLAVVVEKQEHKSGCDGKYKGTQIP